MSLVSNNSNKIFLCSNTRVEIKGKVDIILSPEFYWVRIFDIPVKNISQAKYVLPTLFEDILENINDLSYQVLKLEDDKYLCFAYENKRIFEEIKKSGISLSSVNSIYFAQNECKEYPQFIVNDKSFLYTEDGILVKVPNTLLSSPINLDEKYEELNLSSNKVDIKLYNNVLSSKQIYSLVAVFIILAFVNFYKMFDYKNETLLMEEKIEKLRVTSKLPSSMIQTDSIIKKYKKIVSKEKIKREAIEYILRNKSFKLKRFSLEKDVLNLSFINTDKRKAEKFISKKYKILSSKVSSLNLNIKVKL
ncbi:hypothetical protein [Poseidonibacter lekithochrous]|uniref:hypothetical protein n=1 Tax=Poseidonibacter lekithochrous TaxID=1904463 RepID=UPI0008FCDABF|nr:hypothetical protein [Poseidonibacter lekithochrous]QKJ23865.1 hypothetical protein ALEK_2634 [Poseidonibacter lekithochrous]